MTLNGKRIVVLGGSSGIGLATAQAAAREGAEVVIASSRKARIDRALTTLPRQRRPCAGPCRWWRNAGLLRPARCLRSFGIHCR